MHCPLCEQTLTPLAKELFSCPAGDGILLASSYLIDKHKHNPEQVDPWTSNPKSGSIRGQALHCPHCSAAMHKVDYNSTGIVIDTCSACNYRWLDAGEFKKIKDHKPDMHPDDMLHLYHLQEKISGLDARSGTEPDNPNPDVPLYRFGRYFTAGSSHRTASLLLAGSLWGVISGLIRSKATRILVIVMVIILGVFGYFVIRFIKGAYSLE